MSRMEFSQSSIEIPPNIRPNRSKFSHSSMRLHNERGEKRHSNRRFSHYDGKFSQNERRSSHYESRLSYPERRSSHYESRLSYPDRRFSQRETKLGHTMGSITSIKNTTFSPLPLNSSQLQLPSSSSFPSLLARTTSRNAKSVRSNSLYSEQIIQSSFSSFGILGLVGRTSIFVLDVLTDIFLIVALWQQINTETAYPIMEQDDKIRFEATVAIIITPTILNNILSLYWYFRRHKVILEGRNVLQYEGVVKKAFCILLHCCLLGQLMRYIDSFQHERRVQSYYRYAMSKEGTNCPPRRTAMGIKSSGPHKILTGDSANLDMMKSFFQDCPLLLLQIFILYRTQLAIPEISTYNNKQWNMAATAQILKIVVAWLFIGRSTVLFQSITGHTENYLSLGSKVVCLLWRFSIIGARVIAIGSFASLQFNRNGSLRDMYEDAVHKGIRISFPLLASLVVIGHWCVMVIWIYSQETSFCGKNGSQRTFREFFYDLFLAWIHVFVYINLKDKPTRRRMVFIYGLFFVENSALLFVWYMQLVSIPLWLRVMVPFSSQLLFILGLSCLISYYAFLHKVPKESSDNEDNSS